MRLYTVHCGRTRDEGGVVLVKEGFCWPAFIFGGFWALWHRMWVLGAALIVLDGALDAIPELFAVNPLAHVIGVLGLHAIFGYVANDIRRRHLARRGFDEASVVVGRSREEAEVRFLDGVDRLRQGMVA